MNNIRKQCNRHRLVAFMVATWVAVVVTPPAAVAAPVPVYGGPTYSSTTGGYWALDNSPGLNPGGHVNDAGVAVATASKIGSGGTKLGLRANSWSAGSAPAELGGAPTFCMRRRRRGSTTPVASSGRSGYRTHEAPTSSL